MGGLYGVVYCGVEVVDVLQDGVAEEGLQLCVDGALHGDGGRCAAVVEVGVVRYGGLAPWYHQHEVVGRGLLPCIFERRHRREAEAFGRVQVGGEEACLVNDEHCGWFVGLACCDDGQSVEGGDDGGHQQGEHPE